MVVSQMGALIWTSHTLGLVGRECDAQSLAVLLQGSLGVGIEKPEVGRVDLLRTRFGEAASQMKKDGVRNPFAGAPVSKVADHL